jgi:hypothetical protein
MVTNFNHSDFQVFPLFYLLEAIFVLKKFDRFVDQS